ncbi:hypothetical protein DFH07DRAFT_486571 [Mycena maculata]|uniref:C2H2-type domain-containing protein n=1 Tax=Mycena maculata TaxID=230809 RepID=A0AAD7ND13_9AGAR|nr:hypothetical protein DFH07DRAFT_486571 [Mycena maculata]
MSIWNSQHGHSSRLVEPCFMALISGKSDSINLCDPRISLTLSGALIGHPVHRMILLCTTTLFHFSSTSSFIVSTNMFNLGLIMTSMATLGNEQNYDQHQLITFQKNSSPSEYQHDHSIAQKTLLPPANSLLNDAPYSPKGKEAFYAAPSPPPSCRTPVPNVGAPVVTFAPTVDSAPNPHANQAGEVFNAGTGGTDASVGRALPSSSNFVRTGNNITGESADDEAPLEEGPQDLPPIAFLRESQSRSVSPMFAPRTVSIGAALNFGAQAMSRVPVADPREPSMITSSASASGAAISFNVRPVLPFNNDYLAFPLPSDSSSVVPPLLSSTHLEAPASIAPPQVTTPAAASASDALPTSPSSRKFRCPRPNCNKAYRQAQGLDYHLAHSSCAPDALNRSSKLFPCNCGKSYKNHNGLKYHMAHGTCAPQEASTNSATSSNEKGMSAVVVPPVERTNSARNVDPDWKSDADAPSHSQAALNEVEYPVFPSLAVLSTEPSVSFAAARSLLPVSLPELPTVPLESLDDEPAPRYDSLIRRRLPRAQYRGPALEAACQITDARMGKLQGPPPLGMAGVVAFVEGLRAGSGVGEMQVDVEGDQGVRRRDKEDWWVAPRPNTAPAAAYAALLEERFGPGNVLRGEGAKPVDPLRNKAGPRGRRRGLGLGLGHERSVSAGTGSSGAMDVDMEESANASTSGSGSGSRVQGWIAEIEMLVKGKKQLLREDLKALEQTMHEITNMDAAEGRALGDDAPRLRKALWQLAQLEDIPFHDEYRLRGWARRLIKHWPSV